MTVPKNEIISANTPIDRLSGISTVRKKSFEALGVTTLGELLDHFPRSYQNRKDVKLLSDAQTSLPSSFILTVATEPKSVMLKGRLKLTKFKAFDDSGSCEVIFYNRTYAEKSYPRGSVHRFYGKLTRERGDMKLNSPESEPYYDGADLLPMVPVYPLSAGLSQKILISSVRRALDAIYSNGVTDLAKASIPPTDPIPSEIRKKYKLCTRSYAYENIHFPKDEDALITAGERLAFEELFLLSVRMSLVKKTRKSTPTPCMHDTDLTPFLSLLPYSLTGAQLAVCNSIARDMSSFEPMSRLVAGDVGSGKTVCAAAGAYIAMKNGHQSAIMAPTEILARQHFTELSVLFEKLGFKTELLVGSTRASEKKRILENLAEGKIDLIIGTHSLIEDKVKFKSLGLAVTDEQHRFGVRQRAALGTKSSGVHVLVMSATPIPRTLALILYGDLDISQINEMPPGRQRVDTFVVNESYRERLNAFIRKQVECAHKVYIVCPTVDEVEHEDDGDVALSDYFEFYEKEEKPALRSTVEYARRLKEEVFPDLNVGYVHGKMKSSEKQAAMDSFVRGDTDILVSTTVIEVGVNVPEATLMIVENAERFGLSQLHQLRGRVGRGRDKSYCILVSEAKSGSNAAKRLEVMKNSSDGFAIAEKDLEQRGPGDFLSLGSDLRQHGRFKLKLAAYTKPSLMIAASNAAAEVVALDPSLSMPEHAELARALKEQSELRADTVN